MEKLVQTLKDYYQDNLVSVYQYGFPVKNATIHLLIILKDVTAEAVKPKKFAPPKLSGPIQYTLFSQDEITEALDVFPLEFLAMETKKTLLAGTDIHTVARQMGTSVLMLERHYSKLTATMAAEQLA